MAELVGAIGLAASIFQLIQVTNRVTHRLAELKRSVDGIPETMEHISSQLPLLIELVNQIDVDTQQRKRSIDAAITARRHLPLTNHRDESLVGAIEGLRRQVENLDAILFSMQPHKHSFIHFFKKTLTSFGKEREIRAIERRIEPYKSLLVLNYSIPIEARRGSQSGLTSYNVLPRHVPRFLGREKVLNEIKEFHQAPNDSGAHRIVLLQGMGGQGKTQTALEYCRRFRERRLNAKIVWVDASSPTSVLRSFDQIYALMVPTDDSKLDQKYKRVMVLQEIASWDCPWLIVYDNFDKPNLFGNIHENFPIGKAGAILFTTRSSQAAEGLGYCIKLAGIDLDDGVDLFIYRSGCKKDRSTTAEAAKIVERLGFLPLAVDQAAAYVKAKRLSPSEFWKHFDMRRVKVLEHTPVAEWEYRRSASESEHEKSLSVFTTWELSLEEFKSGTAENKFVDNFLTFASIFHSSTISEILFQHITLKSIEDGTITKGNEWLAIFLTEDRWDSSTYQDVVAQCYELSLLQTFNIIGPRTTFTLHPLIADWLRLRKSSGIRWRTLQEAALYLASFISDHQDFERTMCNRYPFDFAIAWEVVYYIDDVLVEELSFRAIDSQKQLSAEYLEAFASVYWAMDKFYESRELLSRAVDMYRLEKGEEDELTLVATHSLGEVKSHLDELDDAQQLFNQVLESRKKLFGLTHRSLIEPIYQIGVINRRKGEYAPAIDAFRTCLDAVEAGEVDRNCAADWYASLGGALARTSQVEEAERTLRISMDICTAAGLQTGVEYMWPVNWLVRLLCAMDRIDEANSTLMATHGRIFDKFGPNSWEACFIDELRSVVAFKRGEYEEAEKILQACLETYNKKYDDRFDVDEILGVTHALGEVNWKLGNIKESHRLLLNAANGYQRMCGVGTSTQLEPLGTLLEVLIEERDVMMLEQTMNRIELTLNRVFDTEALYVLKVKTQLSLAHSFLGRAKLDPAHP